MKIGFSSNVNTSHRLRSIVTSLGLVVALILGNVTAANAANATITGCSFESSATRPLVINASETSNITISYSLSPVPSGGDVTYAYLDSMLEGVGAYHGGVVDSSGSLNLVIPGWTTGRSGKTFDFWLSAVDTDTFSTKVGSPICTLRLTYGPPAGLELVAYEGFDYATGSLENLNGGSGWTSAWSGSWPFQVQGTSLAYTDLNSRGGSIRYYNFGENSYSANARSLPKQNSGIVYIQFLSDITLNNGGGAPEVRLFDNGVTTAAIGNNGGSTIDILDGSLDVHKASSTSSILGLHMNIVQIDYTALTTKLWVDPVLSTFDYLNPPAPSATATGFAPSFNGLNPITKGGTYDEIKVMRVVASDCIEGTDYTSSTNGDYVTVTFTNTASACSFKIPASSSVNYLIVGGGGGGGGGGLYYTLCTETNAPMSSKPGGGGAGGGGGKVLSGTLAASKDDSFLVRVGAGGAGGSAGGCQAQVGYTADGAGLTGGTGANSSLAFKSNASLVATGGTGGSGGSSQGRAGDSGGDSGSYTGGTNSTATTNCAYNATTGCWSAPGGAGAGANGGSPRLFSNTCQISGVGTSIQDADGGNGGAGFTWSVTGLGYGGGGGGGIRHPYTNPGNCPTVGGTYRVAGSAVDGGGNGAVLTVGSSASGVAGADGRGGGGGGGRGNGNATVNQSNAGLGGNGGRGTVIIRYSLAATQTVTFHGNGGTFTGGGFTATQEAIGETALTSVTGLGLINGQCRFVRWTTEEDGTGAAYTDGANFDFDADDDLWAQWNCSRAAITGATVGCDAAFTSPAITSLTATVAKKGAKNTISGVSPGAVYYWAEIKVPVGDTSGVVFSQTPSTGSLRLTPIGSNLVFSTGCVLQKNPKITVSANGASASISNASGGTSYIVAIKLGAGTIVGATLPAYPFSVTWTFTSALGAPSIQLVLNSK